MSTAWACPPTATQVAQARAAFDDAEIEQAANILQSAVENLGCQTAVVDGLTLLELYRLDGLVALSRMDTKAAVYATIRAVTVDPSAAPPPQYGPELAELHHTWSDRLRTSTATLGINGGGGVWVDGQAMTHGNTRVVLQGEHLLQIDMGGDFASHVMDVTGDHVVETGAPPPPGVPGPVMPGPMPAPVGPRPVPVPAPVPIVPSPLPDPLDPDRPKKRKRPVALWAAGGAALVAGGATFGWAAYQDEVVFPSRQFPDEPSVDRAASQVRIAYGTGYGLMGVGGVLLVTNAIGFSF
ncbi:MAG: hypothetical protein H6737_20615 [Alphaproteobacteria bacterium]|nr:hypothetical protein [Alphaproteobacteria bacterium]